MAKTKSGSLARLTPNAMVVTVDGTELRVAASKEENAIMNMVVASQMRHLIQLSIKGYKDKDAILTPKELADLAKAARDVAAFSAEVYSGVEPIADQTAKKEERADTSSDVSFENLGTIDVTPKKDDIQPGDKETGPDGERPNGDKQG